MASYQTSTSSSAPTFSVGSLVSVRGRDWVVLPDSTDDILRLQPLGGTSEDATGIYLPLERDSVKSASFALPNPQAVGDARSCRLLREAARLGFRSGAGPFRSFGSIAVEPRPYQLVPLLMALQLDSVRLLIADDVGIGKTVEAGLIARELWDRGEITTLAVLCPPHLAEQWVAELRDKFHLEAVAVLSSTAANLEKNCAIGESLFNHHPVTVVSLDFIKTERHRNEFLQHCPDLVIVDEAHTCAQAGTGARQQRNRLLRDIAKKQEQHLLLVSATPHSGNADAFRSLLALLKPQFELLPNDLGGQSNEPKRRELARHLVQRRRADIEHFSAANTPFPRREEREVSYSLSPEYKRFFDKVLAYARESVQDTTGGHFRQRVRWWAALGLLRALASSPSAAAATLSARARNADALSPEEADEIGRRGVFDLEDETVAAADLTPGALVEPDSGSETASDNAGENAGENGRGNETSQRLRRLASDARALSGASDRKLAVATEQVKELLNDGFAPIVFCRFIDTAEEVKNHLRTKLRGVEVVAVTGLLSPEDRKAEVEELAAATQEGKKRVLVATDCLSEGINLQAYFNAVLHYDLAWNPTRHEQREGRVDRFGQPSSKVRVVTLYGVDNQIDGLVLDVLLRKGQEIRKSLGVSVPVPTDSDAVAEAIFEGLLLRGVGVSSQQLALFEDLVEKKDNFHQEWQEAGEREKRSRTMFAQYAIKPKAVSQEVEAMTKALGGGAQVEGFVRDSLASLEVQVAPTSLINIDLNTLPEAVREPLVTTLPRSAWKAGIKARFDTANASGEILLGRTHPIVAALASFVFESALDEKEEHRIASRCGAMRTESVKQRTTLLLLRMRFQLHQSLKGGKERSLLAEDCAIVAFRGAPSEATWLSDEEAEALLSVKAAGNIARDQASRFVEGIQNDFESISPHLAEVTQARAQELLQAHQRAREAVKSSTKTRVEAQLPPDVLGMWVFLPPLPVA